METVNSSLYRVVFTKYSFINGGLKLINVSTLKYYSSLKSAINDANTKIKSVVSSTKFGVSEVKNQSEYTAIARISESSNNWLAEASVYKIEQEYAIENGKRILIRWKYRNVEVTVDRSKSKLTHKMHITDIIDDYSHFSSMESALIYIDGYHFANSLQK